MEYTPFKNQRIEVGDVVISITANGSRAIGEEFVVRETISSINHLYVYYREGYSASEDNFRIVRKNNNGVVFCVGDRIRGTGLAVPYRVAKAGRKTLVVVPEENTMSLHHRERTINVSECVLLKRFNR